MTTAELTAQYKARASAERAGGGVCVVDTALPNIFICRADGEQWYFEYHEADKVLAEVPTWINAEDFLLAAAQNW